MENKEKVMFDISIWTILKIVLVLLGLWVLFLIKDVLIIILVVGIIATALEPLIARLAKQGIPRSVSVLVLYLGLLLLITAVIYFILPPVIEQIRELALNLPYYSEKISQLDLSTSSSTISKILNELSARLSNVAGGLFTALVSVFGGLVSTITVMALTYYVMIDEGAIKKVISNFIPIGKEDRFISTMDKVSIKLGDWLQGQLALMMIVGVVDGIALWGLGIPYALTLGLLSGLLEIIPIVGPILAGATAVLIAFISGVALWKIAVVIAIYILVQQLENQILVPKIMQKAIGLSPIIVILAILTGSKLLGTAGAILAIPVAAGIQVFVQEYLTLNKKQ